MYSKYRQPVSHKVVFFKEDLTGDIGLFVEVVFFMAKVDQRDFFDTFRTALGWMAIVGRGTTLRALAFGHPSAGAALQAIDPRLIRGTRRQRWNERLVGKLKEYASGQVVDFSDIDIDCGPSTEFQSRVLSVCRKIPWGQTLTYGQLAAAAGYAGAARAAGHCMATNRVPLVVPCHRVLGADRRLRGYSAPGGLGTKSRLLELEGAMLRP